MYSTLNGWYTPSLGVCVTIINESGQYHINVTETDDDYTIFGEYMSQGTVHEDITKTFLVPDGETWFDVMVEKRVGGGWTSLEVISPIRVPSLTGNPIVYLVTDGTQ